MATPHPTTQPPPPSIRPLPYPNHPASTRSGRALRRSTHPSVLLHEWPCRWGDRSRPCSLSSRWGLFPARRRRRRRSSWIWARSCRCTGARSAGTPTARTPTPTPSAAAGGRSARALPSPYTPTSAGDASTCRFPLQPPSSASHSRSPPNRVVAEASRVLQSRGGMDLCGVFWVLWLACDSLFLMHICMHVCLTAALCSPFSVLCGQFAVWTGDILPDVPFQGRGLEEVRILREGTIIGVAKLHASWTTNIHDCLLRFKFEGFQHVASISGQKSLKECISLVCLTHVIVMLFDWKH
jgi:hypothetical protein